VSQCGAGAPAGVPRQSTWPRTPPPGASSAPESPASHRSCFVGSDVWREAKPIFVTVGATLSSWLAAHSGTDVASYVSIGGRRRPGLRGLSRNAGEARPRHPSCYFFREALFVLVTHDDGVSLHLRNAGTTSACSSVGSFRLVRVSLVRFAPALYPIF
jgi:hypothetical protein